MPSASAAPASSGNPIVDAWNNIVDPTNAALSNFVQSVPIAGPTLANTGAGVDAAFNRAVGAQAQTPEAVQAEYANDEARYPVASTIGGVAGTVLPIMAAGGAIPGAAKVLGMEGPLALRVGAGAASSGAIGTADAFARGEDPRTALTQGAVDTAVGGALPFAGVALGHVLGSGAAVPTVDDLKAQAGGLYDQARASGVVIPQADVAATANDIASQAITDGIDPALHPRATAGLLRVQAAAGSPMTVQDAMTMRRVLGSAASDNSNPDEQRIARAMMGRFDNMTTAAAPELARANQLYSTAKKGQAIEQAIELAGSRAGQFSGSGFENALRTEFRGMQRQIIKGQIKGLSPDEVAAINKTANGGPVENALRLVGKAAPTNIVSFGVDAGVPFSIGNAVGGPAMGAAASGATMGLGLIARALATRMTAANANMASAIARNGGKAVQTVASPVGAALLKSLGGPVGGTLLENRANGPVDPVARALMNVTQ